MTDRHSDTPDDNGGRFPDIAWDDIEGSFTTPHIEMTPLVQPESASDEEFFLDLFGIDPNRKRTRVERAFSEAGFYDDVHDLVLLPSLTAELETGMKLIYWPHNTLDMREADFRPGKLAQVGSVIKGKPTKERNLYRPNGVMREIHKLTVSTLRTYGARPHEAAVGGEPGKSALDFLSPHEGNSHFFKLDLVKAYENVDLETLATVLAELTLDIVGDEEVILPTLLRYFSPPSGQGLALGGNAAPYLFNMALLPLDQALSDYAAARGLVYTRYLDDLLFSSPDGAIGGHKRGAIKQYIRDAGFAVNPKKVRHKNVRTDGPLVIAGLQINENGHWSMPSLYARNIRKFFRGELDRVAAGEKITVQEAGLIHGVYGYVSFCKNPRYAHKGQPREEQLYRELKPYLPKIQSGRQDTWFEDL